MSKRPRTLLDVIRADRELAALYAEEELLFHVTEAIAQAMKERGVTQSDLARQLGISRQAVSALLQGRNVTVRRVAKVLHALGFRLDVRLEDETQEAAGGAWPDRVQLTLVEPSSTWQPSREDHPASADLVA